MRAPGEFGLNQERKKRALVTRAPERLGPRDQMTSNRVGGGKEWRVLVAAGEDRRLLGAHLVYIYLNQSNLLCKNVRG